MIDGRELARFVLKDQAARWVGIPLSGALLVAFVWRFLGGHW